MKKSLGEGNQLWEEIRNDAHEKVKQEPSSASIFSFYLDPFPTLEESLSHLLLEKLDIHPELAKSIAPLFSDTLAKPEILSFVRCDLIAYFERDPACNSPLIPFLFYKGFHALVIHRIAHHLWEQGEKVLAYSLQSYTTKVFSIDIHPAAVIGPCIFIDHGNSIVIGETCIIGKSVSILQDVTLGGTGKEEGDRHPKIEDSVLIGAGAKVLGNIRIGKGSKIGASSVVLSDIPPHSVAVGIPAKVVGTVGEETSPAEDMDHSLDL